MANLDTAWQASVIKLAQAGNSRAIAFWMNHYLVPQGICAQVETDQAGGLVIRVVCRQVPDCDRLVRFICHRLCKLNSDTLRHVRISAQMVGTSTVLWEKSARLIPPAERKTQPQKVQSQKAIDQPGSNIYAFPKSPQAVASAAASAASTEEISTGTIPQRNDPAQAEPQIVSQPPTTNATNAALKLPLRAKRSAKTQVGDRSKNWKQLPQAWQPSVQNQISTLRRNSLDVAERSIRWFAQQKPSMRALLLGGSAVTAFLVGCSFELFGYYADPTAFQQSKTTLTKMIRSASAHTGSVKAALEQVPVTRQPVLNPDDPTINLIFTNSATLTRLPASQRTRWSNQNNQSNQIDQEADPPLVTTIENYRLADMIVTNLSDPLGSTSSSSKASAASISVNSSVDPSSPDAGLDQSDRGTADDQLISESQPATSESAGNDGLTLKDLPHDIDVAADSSDEMEKARFATDPEESEPGEAGSEQTQPERNKVPLLPQELLANGVDVVNVASNRIMPEGAAQLASTLDRLKQDGIYTVGAGQTGTEARRPQIFDVKGQRIAYLGYSDSSAMAAEASKPGINVNVNQQVEEDIKVIRDQVDWIILSVDWNRELRAYPESWQVDLAHAAIDHGADLVVGYHPTATQGAEIYNGRAIVYSLGDSIDEFAEKPAGDYDTATLKVTIKEHIMELEFLPIKVKRGQAEIAKGDLGQTILQYIEQASSLFDHPLRSPASINSELRLSLPAAPDAAMPTDPFINYPESPASSSPEPASVQ